MQSHESIIIDAVEQSSQCCLPPNARSIVEQSRAEYVQAGSRAEQSNRAEEWRGRGMCTVSRPGGQGGGAEDRAEGERVDEHLDLDVGGLDWLQQKGWEPPDQGAGAPGLRPRATGEDSRKVSIAPCSACCSDEESTTARFLGVAGGRNAGGDMLSCGAVRSLLDRLRLPPRGWKQNPSPAMPTVVNRACLCRFSHSAAHGEGRAVLPGKMGFLHLAGGRSLAPSGALTLKGCLGWQDSGGGSGFRRRVDGEAAGIKTQVLTRQRQLMRDPEVLPLEEAAATAKTLNGNGACRRGKPLGFPEQAVAAKMVVAVDVDEVLGSFLAALNKFIADRYSWNHTVSEYHVYEFFRIWNCSRERANYLVHEFFTTHYFQDGIQPIPGARDALQNLSSFCSLSIVTSRQDAIKNHTLEWIEKYYPGLFEQIHFGNHFALEGKSRPKSEICRSFGAQVLIDDNPRYAMECANDGMRVLLFDYDNSYPWCKTGVDESHPLVTKVHNWEEVEEKLLSWVVPES